ncbi:MAG TPA: hypothetical protein VF172_13705 [Nitrososphaera sp.]
MPARTKVKKVNVQEEQLEILKKILAELQTLNANIANVISGPSRPEAGIPSEGGGSDDEELEDYE